MNKQELEPDLQLLFTSNSNIFIRYGNIFLTIILILIFSLAFIIKFPENVTGSVSVFTYPSSATLVAHSSGRLVLNTEDGQNVQKNEILGYIDNPASVIDILLFSNKIDSLLKIMAKKDFSGLIFQPILSLNLGDIQQVYSTLLDAINSYNKNIRYNTQILQTKEYEEQLEFNENIIKRQTDNLNHALKELSIVSQKFKNDSILFEEDIISLLELENSRLAVIPYKKAVETTQQNIASTRASKSIFHSNITQLKSEYSSNQENSIERVKIALLNAKSQIEQWKDRYLIVSPISGKVSIFNSWNTNQNISTGSNVLSIIPISQEVIAKGAISPIGSGKIKAGDRAIVSLDDFLPEEFGTIEAVVTTAPSIQIDGQYNLLLKLAHGLSSNYNKVIPMRENMTGKVKIITNNVTLAKYVFVKFKKSTSIN